ncbi:MAG: hypothetical protein R3C11_26730 [Planctomycetaceae bacterium]
MLRSRRSGRETALAGYRTVASLDPGGVSSRTNLPAGFQSPVGSTGGGCGRGGEVDQQLLFEGVDWWREQVDLLLIEGVGGWYCPLTETEMIATMRNNLVVRCWLLPASVWGPSIIPCSLSKRCVRGLQVAGVVLNESTPLEKDASIDTNLEQIEKWGKTKVLAVMRYQQPLTLREDLAIDWFSLAGELRGR